MKKSFVLSLLSLALFVMNNGTLVVVGDTELRQTEEADKCEVHFEIQLVSLDGEWEGYVHYASENGAAVLPGDNCKKVTWFQQDTESSADTAIQVQEPMTVDTSKSVIVGIQLGTYEDFYGVLTVTMAQKPNDVLPLREKLISRKRNLLKHSTLSSPPPKVCVFYIGASAPARPVLYEYGFHGANCTLKSPEVSPFVLIAE